jgi:hypothetical protein
LQRDFLQPLPTNAISWYELPFATKLGLLQRFLVVAQGLEVCSEFKVGDHVYLKVSPMKGVHRFGIWGKLARRYVGPFQIQQRCGPVAYRVKLPDHMSAVHDIFHVSQLKKCLQVPDQVVDFGDVELEPDLTYAEYPIRVTRRRTIKFYKVQWNQHTEDEATWESEDYLEEFFPDFFASI